MSEIKDYGEPWAFNNDRKPSMERSRPAYQDRDGKTIPGKSTYADDGAVRDRALACVNALAGREPAKLDALVECYRELLSHGFQTVYGTPGEQLWQRSADALAAFEGRGGDE